MAKNQQYRRLFESGHIGRLITKNRLIMAPMGLQYTEYPHTFASNYIDALEERSRGGVGLIVTAHVEAENEIDPYPIGTINAALDRDYNLRTFADLTERVHRYDVKIVVQISAGTGRCADLPMPEKWPAAPSEVPILRNPQLHTRELSLGEISGLIEAYGKAAERAQRAEFDGIMVHCGDTYLLGQFLNPKWNRRADRYGGSLENRMRFMEECIESVKSRVSSDFPLLAKLATDHMTEGGPSPEEAKLIAKRLEELGVAALYLSIGGYDTKDWLVPPMYYPQGCKVPHIESFKEVVNIPVIVDGRINDPEFAERLLEEGKVDFIGLGRPLLADPEWPKKVKEGRTGDIRSCIYCNECMSRSAKSKYVKCSVNPALGSEKEYRVWPAATRKRVMVIGGGPGGMSAARVAALRGHKVTLYEKAHKLGGNLLIASSPQFKMPIRPIINWLAREAEKAGMNIELGQEVTAKTIEEIKPDVVIVATGSVPAIPDIPGVKGKNVATAIDVLLGKVKVGDEVVMVGGGIIGCETAFHLAQMGKKMTIVEMLADIALDAGSIEKTALLRLLAESRVNWSTGMKVIRITNEGAVASDKDGQQQTFQTDSIVLATGMVANDGLYEELKEKVPEIYKIGDALQARRVFEAIHDGEAVARIL
ncbi:FAD-dependent oxidoreductase [Chloroflexota bacterium]